MTRILISGSTGLIGRALVRRLESSGHEVTRLVRPESTSGVSGIVWDPARGLLDPSELEGFGAVVHLGGENIANRRWSEEQKRRIRDSRVVGTTLLSTALASLDNPPAVLACASAGGYYGDRAMRSLMTRPGLELTFSRRRQGSGKKPQGRRQRPEYVWSTCESASC